MDADFIKRLGKAGTGNVVGGVNQFKDANRLRPGGDLEDLGVYLDDLQPIAPTTDEKYENLQKSQIEDANQFRAAGGATGRGLMTTEADNSKRNLAMKISDIRRGYNNRGLLYSGLRAGEEASARGDYASDLATKRADINRSVADTASELDKRAIDSGFGLAGMGTGALTADNTLTQARAQATREQGQAEAAGRIAKGIGGGIGQLAGSIAAGYAGKK